MLLTFLINYVLSTVAFYYLKTVINEPNIKFKVYNFVYMPFL